MNVAKSSKLFTVGALLIANLAVVGLAKAQAQQSTDTGASSVAASGKHLHSHTATPAGDVLLRGGYNVGRGNASQVPGCIGPVSFCNMYNGS